MTMLTVEGAELHPPRAPWIDDGFRVFFPAAGLFAVISIAAWAAAYNFGHMPPLRGITPFQWHAHEMLYGYTGAVVAGFPLTATERWTGVPRLRGIALLILLLPGCIARVALLFGTRAIELAGRGPRPGKTLLTTGRDSGAGQVSHDDNEGPSTYSPNGLH